ncbi:polar amino acid transport system substrate-binding protein [Inhella inkyongensis]|uniref:Polar amino acid transport system substrate-binding protein n=1 Tax=Inhella inkyongensis TaxID=392593 RepID=A0A840RZU9_9BURK|nr:transporter substrate-binding domain-containing protein [Inhella inkyongensis]MBB5203525.1 polar amino acid transport system substrate-binding protein [Inhella inkyongensis]
MDRPSFLPPLVVGALISSVLFVLPLRTAVAADPLQVLKVCDDGAEWPPYTYYQRDAEGRPTRAVVGYSVEVLNRILEPLGYAAQVDLLPWARCQLEVERGVMYVMALNASPSPEREQRFLLSRAYYSTTHAFFYSKRQRPQGLKVERLADLANYRVCGIHGYNYSAYGIPPAQMDAGASEPQRVIVKLHAGRCDLWLEKYEIVAGTRVTGSDLLADPDLGWGRVPELPGGPFHMLISRQHPQWLDRINAGLARMAAAKELETLLRRHLP